ncbi:MAG: hypothetical protein RPU73_14595 [Candidatus Sedimenticola sp. (ex Thyasira tokunagai)]
MHIAPLSITSLLLMAALINGCNQVREGSGRLSFLNGKETGTLFVGKTVEALNLSTGTSSFTYYSEDGKARQERLWEHRLGNWRINEKGEICLQFGERKEGCRMIGELNGTYRKYRPDKNGQLKPVVRYRRFLEGNVLQL